MEPWQVAALASVLAVAAASHCWVALAAWRRRSAVGADWFALVSGVMAAGTVAVAAVVLTGAPSSAIMPVTTAVALVVPVPWVAFAFEYTGRNELVTRRLLVLVTIPPALGLASALVAYGTNVVPAVRSMAPSAMGGVAGFVVALLGVTTWLSLFFAGGMVLVGTGLVVWTFQRYEHLDADAGTLLAAYGTVPWLSLLAGFQTGLYAPQALQVLVTLGSLVGGVAGVASMTRYRLFASVPAAGAIGPQTVIEELDDIVVVVDATGHVLDLNEMAGETFDATPADAVGGPLSALLGADLAELRAAETVGLRSTEGLRQFEPTVSALSDQHGHHLGSAVVLRDVTDRKTREQRLEVLNRVLRHNLRNDVTAIVGYADQVAEAEEPPTEVAARIVDTAEDLADIGEKAREIERLMATADTAADRAPLAPLVEQVLVSVGAEYPDADYTRSVPEQVVVEGSGYLLERALVNLVENAVEHSSTSPPSQARENAVEHSSTSPPSQASEDAGSASASEPSVADAPEDAVEHSSTSPPSQASEPSVADAPEDAVEHSSTSPPSQARENSVAHDHGETPVVEVAATFDDDRTYPLEVRVSDDGPGIPEQDLAAVRDGDETPLQHGSGLGLWVVQWAVTRLGGEVAFDSSDDAGTTVTVRLPKAHRAEDVGGVRTRELAGDE